MQVKAREDQKQSEDQTRVSKLCAAMNLPSFKDNVAKCELKHFAALVSPELQAFILARHSKFTKKSELSHLKKPRTALIDAANGIENLISVAFDVHKNKSKMLAATNEEASCANDVANIHDDLPPLLQFSSNAHHKYIQPSEILNDPTKLIVM